MPNQPCPHCSADTPRLVEAPSQVASVNYYRCPQCGHVWTVAKDGSGKSEHITPIDR
jgi:transposase-like protein